MPMLALIAQVTLAQALDAELDRAALSGAVVAACVTDQTGEKYSRNPELRMTPASNQKLLATAYALDRLGQESRLTIKFWKVKGGWFIDTQGHPTLTYAEAVSVRERVKIKRTDSLFVRAAFKPVIPPSWEWDDLPNKYAARPSALTVDRGSFELWAAKGRAFLRPFNCGVSVRALGGVQRKIDYDPIKGVVRVYGPIPSNLTRLDTLAVPDPASAAAMALGGNYVPTSRDAPTRPPDATITGPPLIQIVGECLQKSDNNLAENLLLIAAASEGPLGSDPYDTAAKRLTKFLEEKCGAQSGSARPVDGSGLSRHNLISVRSLAKVLVYARDTWGEKWLGALATSGKGTLENRLSGSRFSGKTGSLDSVSALSGYSADSQGNSLVIVLVFNQTIAPASEIRSIQDSIVRKIESYEHGTVFDVNDYCEGRDPYPSYFALYRHRSR